MDGLSVLVGAGSGFVVAAVAVGLLLRAQAAAAQARARDEADALAQRLDARERELAAAREAGAREREGRARAEERAAGLEPLQRRLAAQEAELAHAREAHAHAREQVGRLETALAEERRQGAEKLQLLEAARAQLTVQFKQLAQDILEDKSQRFTEQNRVQLDGVLAPLKEQLKAFEHQVREAYDKETRDRVGLAHEIHHLKELNQRIAQDAVNLTRALKGENKTQGIWGEMILEQVLEKSGLERGREYEVQASFTTEDGRRQQPDVLVHLPEGRHVVVDSKVSLVAFERACTAEDPEARTLALAEHTRSLRAHCRGLSAKGYQHLGVRTLDYVLMFVPVEPAYTEAVRHDPDLFGDALERNVVIVTPSTLLATLRTIQNIWRFEYQNRHATEIADKAGRLYDKFVGLVVDLEDLGKRLDAARKAYDDTFKKLHTGRGNLVRGVEELRVLGAKASKALPEALVELSEEPAGPQQPPALEVVAREG